MNAAQPSQTQGKKAQELSSEEEKSVFAENPGLDRRIIEGMLNDREVLMEEMQTKELAETVTARGNERD